MLSGTQWTSWNASPGNKGGLLYLELLHKRYLPLISLLYSLNQLFVLVWTHKYLLYTLGYNLILLHLFCCSDHSSFGFWEFFLSEPMSLWQTPTDVRLCLFVCLLTLLLFVTTRCFRLIYYISCLSWRSSHLSKECWFFLLSTSVRSHDLDARYHLSFFKIVLSFLYPLHFYRQIHLYFDWDHTEILLGFRLSTG